MWVGIEVKRIVNQFENGLQFAVLLNLEAYKKWAWVSWAVMGWVYAYSLMYWIMLHYWRGRLMTSCGTWHVTWCSCGRWHKQLICFNILWLADDVTIHMAVMWEALKNVGIKSTAWMVKNTKIEHLDARSQQFDLFIKYLSVLSNFREIAMNLAWLTWRWD